MANLRREAAARGIAPERLCFARRVADGAEHRARLGLADLFLDTFPYSAHSSAIEVLRAGVPIVTRTGLSMASRICGGLLRAIGLPELVTLDADEYRDLAIHLLQDAGARATLRHWLQESGPRKIVFDPAVYAQNLEAAFLQALRRTDAARASPPG